MAKFNPLLGTLDKQKLIIHIQQRISLFSRRYSEALQSGYSEAAIGINPAGFELAELQSEIINGDFDL